MSNGKQITWPGSAESCLSERAQLLSNGGATGERHEGLRETSPAYHPPDCTRYRLDQIAATD
jgi:hypothetical protein